MPGQNATILLVDDTPSILDSISTALQHEGYTVLIANSGQKALERLEYVTPDLILLDILMPGMDGYETCRKIYEKNDRRIPVIFLSALSDPFDKVKAFRSGSVDYITKPVEITELYARVDTHIQLKKNRESLERKNRELEQTLFELNETQNLLVQQARFSVAGEVINNIAHQWRQPLHVVTLWADELRTRLEEQGVQDTRFDEPIRRIIETTHTLSDTINDMARLFQSSERKVFFDITTQIKETLALIRDKLDDEAITAHCHPYESLEIDNYPNSFTQALMHILHNTIDSLKSIPDNRELLISVEKNSDPLRTAYITIRDSGSGIDPTIIDKMFEPYTTTKFKYFGTGLSLYISKLIIEKQMGGLLYSRNGLRGAEFIIEL